MGTRIIGDLNAIPPDVLDEARRLDGEERYRFLWERVTPVNRAFLRHFIRDVVEGGADAGSWGFGKILFPDLSLAGLLARSAAEVVRPLGRPAEDGWLIRVVTSFSKDAYDPYVGAPAVLRRELKYSSGRRPGVSVHLLGTVTKLHPVAELEPAVRRWMAYRAGMAAGFRRERLTDRATILEILGVDPGSISTDAVQALEALAAEARMDSSPRLPPGFRGADSLYA